MRAQHLALAGLLWSAVGAGAWLSGQEDPVWTDPQKAAEEDPDFTLQGEYFGETEKEAWGAQVIALGDGRFEAYLLRRGLPGQGWQPWHGRTTLFGEREGAAEASFVSADETIEARTSNGRMQVMLEGEPLAALDRIERQSSTLGAASPLDAVVLFDGSGAAQWQGGEVVDGLLAASNAMSVPRFRDYTLHLEFRTPYRPFARGQKRGNSGVYFGGRWETQILDSFGLTGEMNECGGIYSIARPALNMCFPPLSWQTYDVDFTAARFDEKGQLVAWPRMTVRLNGVVIHDEQALGKTHTTAAPIRDELTDEPGPVFLQDHRNPVRFRNIWVKEN